VSQKARSDPRGTPRTAAARQSAARERAARKAGAPQASPREQPAPRRPAGDGLSFVDMLLIASLVLLGVAIAAAAFFVLRGSF